jgi:lysophospholipase L1-like esterase
LRKAFADHLAKNNSNDKESGILTTDRVHLNDAGNKLVAETILAVIDK